MAVLAKPLCQNGAQRGVGVDDQNAFGRTGGFAHRLSDPARVSLPLLQILVRAGKAIIARHTLRG
jgi:hypothetical protein